MPRSQKRAPAKSVQRVGKPDGANAAKAKPKAQTAIRDRVVGLRRVPARDLLANPKNWRRHPESQRSALGGMLSEVGIADALIARETPAGLMLIDGHLRQDVLADQDVPVLVLDVTEGEADKLLLTLDPLAAMAEMDGAMVRELLDGVVWESQDGISALLDDLAQQSDKAIGVADGLTDPDDAPPVPDEPISKRGDVWLCGDHRVMCGDATSAEDVAQVLGGQMTWDLVTDPPYGMNLDTDWSGIRGTDQSLGFKKAIKGKAYPRVRGDDVPFDPSPLNVSLIAAMGVGLSGISVRNRRLTGSALSVWSVVI